MVEVLLGSAPFVPMMQNVGILNVVVWAPEAENGAAVRRRMRVMSTNRR